MGTLVLPRFRMLGFRTDGGRAGVPLHGRSGARAAGGRYRRHDVLYCRSSCPARHDAPAPVRLAPRTRLPASAASVLAGPPDVVAEDVAQRLFAFAPVIVVAGPGPQADAAAARLALRAHAPLLLTAVRPGHSAPGGAATMAFRTAGTTGAAAVWSAPRCGRGSGTWTRTSCWRSG